MKEPRTHPLPLLMLLLSALLSCDRTPSGEDPAARVRSVRVEPEADTLVAGTTDTLRATALDASGGALRGVRIAWTSSDMNVATVDTAGAVVAGRVGEVVIRATAGAAWAEARIIVMIPPRTTCQAQGTVHDGGTATGMWRAVDSPHRVTTSISVQDLTIEAGALVCFSLGTRLSVGSSRLVARGTAAAPIVFTAADTAAPWAGISDGTQGGTVTLSHVLLENATMGVNATKLMVDSSRIRQIHAGPGSVTFQSGTAVLAVTGRLLATTVDTADAGFYPADWYAGFAIEHSVLRGAGAGVGVYCRRSGSISVRGTRIESFGTALEFEEYTAGDCTLADATGARLTRNGRSANLQLNAASVLLSEAGPDSLRGNASDTLWTFGSATGDIVIPAGIPVAASGLEFGGAGALRLLPGASLTVYTGLTSSFALGPGQRMVALGTAAAPVELSVAHGQFVPPAQLGGAPGAPSQLSHVEVRGMHIVAGPGRPIVVDSSHFTRGASLILRAAGSRVSGSLLEDAADTAAVVLGANGVGLYQTVVERSGPVSSFSPVGGTGIRIDADSVQVDGCAVSGSAGDGVRVTSGRAIVVRHCNLAGNAGVGLANAAADTVDARLNWWGDAAGPTAPNAARAVGLVNYTPWATSPFTIVAALATAAARTP